jgi:adenine/guanine/hypoxanthine permease
MVIPFTWSITNGIGFGFITYVLVRVAQRRWRVVHPLMYAIALGFAVYFAVPLLRQEFGFH